jgi:protein-tyrosine-phosphatase
MRVLFVCSGNTCRSPFAEAVARHLRPDLDFASAGIIAVDGIPCPPEATGAAAELGFDLGGHRSRVLDRGIVAGSDLVVGMDSHHVQAARVLGGAQKTRLLADMPILDPFGGDSNEYRARYTEIEAAIAALLAELFPRHTPPWEGKELHPPPAASVPRKV